MTGEFYLVLSFSSALQRATSAFFKNFWAIVAINLLCFFPANLVLTCLNATGLRFVQDLNLNSQLPTLVLPLASAAVLLKLNSPKESLGQILRAAVWKWIPLLVGSAALGLLSALGFLLLLLPGLLASSLFFLFEPMFICEGLDFADSLRQSPYRMKACWGKGIALWMIGMLFFGAILLCSVTMIPSLLSQIGLPEDLSHSRLLAVFLDLPVNMMAAYAIALKFAAWEATRPQTQSNPAPITGFTPTSVNG